MPLLRLSNAQINNTLRKIEYSPAQLFANGEQGAWYDPSDFSTLYQDSAGTTPVTALGQPVGLMLDRSGNGNHASQATAAARPTVQARVNLLERTEEFDETSYWGLSDTTVDSNAVIAPDGTLTADKLIATSSNSTHFLGRNNLFVADGTMRTWSIYVKQGEYRYVSFGESTVGDNGLVFDTQEGVYTDTGTSTYFDIVHAPVNVGNGWWRIAYSSDFATTFYDNFKIFITTSPTSPASTFTGDDTSGVYIWGAQLEQGSSPTTYQRVTTATDYQDIGLPRYLEFDGVDDAMATQSVDFSSTDEMTAVLGIERFIAGAQVAIEHSINSALEPNSFAVFAYISLDWRARSHGSTYVDANFTDSVVSRRVIALRSDISDPIVSIRADGVTEDSVANSQGTGNYGDYPLYIGARAASSLYLQGRIHQLIVRGATTAGNLLDQTERFVARKTGVTL